MTAEAPASARLARGVALGGHLGLLALVVAWNAWWSPSTLFPVALVLLLQGVPLLLPLHGLLHGRLYTHAWNAMLVLAYFAFGVMEAYSNPAERAFGIALAGLSLATFTGCLVYVRRQARWLRRRARQEALDHGD